MTHRIVTRRDLLVWAGLALVLILGAYLRYSVVTRSSVFAPYRADAAVYYNTAFNLRKYGIYSRDGQTIKDQHAIPKPDAFATPGYPLFLAAFVDAPPSIRIFRTVAMWQVALGVLTVLLVFLLFSQITDYRIAVLVSLLTAISPHLVNTTVYLLSETVFTFWLALALLVFCLHTRGTRWYYPALLLAGLLFGIAALTRPVVELFPLVLILLLGISQPKLKAAKGAAAIALGFMLAWGPWLVRNHLSLDQTGDSTVMMSSLHQGMYPGMMYQDDPRSLGYAYDADPDYKADNRSMSTVIHAILRQFEQHPARELYWYLIGKPVMLWSWTLISGPGDIFIYPTEDSPYDTGAPVFIFSHALMHGLHWIIVILALLGCILVWLPYAKRHLNNTQLLLARMTGLLLFYNTGVLMVLAPYVRYSIPFLPFEFGMALLAAYVIGKDVNMLRKQSRQSQPG